VVVAAMGAAGAEIPPTFESLAEAVSRFELNQNHEETSP